MNIVIAILLCFALLGAADKILGGKLGVAQEFDRGLAAMGPLCVSMAGIYCVAVYALSSASKDIAALTRGLPFDPSLLLSMLLATDMGGWAAAKELAATPELAVYSGLLVASTMGCLISFTLPVSLGGLARHEVMGFMQGVVWGIVALPAGLLLGAVVCGLSAAQTLWNVLPVLVLCVLFIAALKFAPRGCIVFLTIFGQTVRVVGILLFCVMTAGLFLPAFGIVPQDIVLEALLVILKITAVVCGATVASALLMAKAGRFLERFSRMLGVNEYAVLGLLANLVSNVSMLPLYRRMDVRGKVMNAAFCVSGAFIIGGQLAFVSGVAPDAVGSFFACKLVGGILAAALALKFTHAQPAQEEPAPQPGGVS